LGPEETLIQSWDNLIYGSELIKNSCETFLLENDVGRLSDNGHSGTKIRLTCICQMVKPK